MKDATMKRIARTLFALAALPLAAAVMAASPLEPVKTDNPRDTMRTFMESMNDYRQGLEKRDDRLMGRIDRAVRCFDLEEGFFLEHQEKAREHAVLLKEVIDRVIVIDYDKIPEGPEGPGEKLLRWRLRGTEITIARKESGERAGEYLFTRETAGRAKEFYEKVKHLPYLEGSGQGALYRGTWFEETVPAWMKERFVFLKIWQWAGLFLAIFLGLLVKFMVRLGVDLVNRISARSKRVWFMKTAKAFSGPTSLLAATLFWYVSYRLLGFDGGVQTFLRVVLQVLLAGALLWLLYRLMGVFSDYLAEVASRTQSTLDDKLVPIATRAMRIFVVIFGALVAVQNMGLNVMSVLAGLGIGGLAFALAGKDMVANFFGSLMILFNGPFQVGDWIIVGSAEGTVEEIGFRTTKIRTFYNSVITIPNGELVIKEVDNMGRREYRRVMATIGVTYGTPPDLLRGFIDGIRNIIAENPHSKKDAIYVVFNGYGDSSLDILIYYFLKVPDWMTELEQKEDVYMHIFRLAARMGVDFAFPTRTVHMEGSSGEKGAGGVRAGEDTIVPAGD